jgi:hypothetical protein
MSLAEYNRGATQRGLLFAQPKSLISHSARFFLDEYRAIFPVNVTSPYRTTSQTLAELSTTLIYRLGSAHSASATGRFRLRRGERNSTAEDRAGFVVDRSAFC